MEKIKPDWFYLRLKKNGGPMEQEYKCISCDTPCFIVDELNSELPIICKDEEKRKEQEKDLRKIAV